MKIEYLDGLISIEHGTLTLAPDTLPEGVLGPLLNAGNGGRPIVLTAARKQVSDNTITITATADLLNVRDLAVTAIFSLDASGTPVATLRFKLIDNAPGATSWRFSQSFPKLPGFPPRPGTALDRKGPPPHFLDTLPFRDAAFVLTTAKESQDAAFGTPLGAGLNFVAKLHTAGIFGVLGEALGEAPDLVIHGQIVPQQPTQPLPRLKQPWQADWPVPGIHLRADLGIDLKLDSTLRFHDTALHIYIPLSGDWPAQNHTYFPTRAITAKLESANIKADLQTSMVQPSGGITFVGLFDEASLDNLAKLAELVNGKDLFDHLPEELKQAGEALGGISLKWTRLTLGEKLLPTEVQVAVGIDHRLPLLPGFDLTGIGVEFGVNQPFAPARSVSLRLSGEMQAIGTKLWASGQVDSGSSGLALEGGMRAGEVLKLKELAKWAGLDLPANVPDILFSEVHIQLDTRPGQRCLAFSGYSTLAANIPLAAGKAPLALTLGMDAVTYDFDKKTLSGSFEGEIRLDEVSFTTTLALAEGGKTVSIAQGDEPLDLKRLVERLVPGDLILPPELPQLGTLEIAQIKGDFTLGSKDFSFTGTTSLNNLGIGSLMIEQASGTIEVQGRAGALEQLTLDITGQVGTELVPDLKVESLQLLLELKQQENKGWQWHVGGKLVVKLPGVEAVQTLQADARNAAFCFELNCTPSFNWALPELLLDGSFSRFALSLEKNGKTKAVEWSLVATCGVKVGELPRVSGTLGLYNAINKKGFELVADQNQEPLAVALELVPGDARMKVGGSLKIERFSLLKQSGGWELCLEDEFSFLVPQPSRAGSDDPIDQTLTFLNSLLNHKTNAKLIANKDGVAVGVKELSEIEVPFPVLKNGDAAWDQKTKVQLTDLSVSVGKACAAKGTLKLRLPDGINNLFGETGGKPEHVVLSRDLKLGLEVKVGAGKPSENGLSLWVESTLLDLSQAGCFSQEKDANQRNWTRFKLDRINFRYGSFVDLVENKTRWHLDFGEMGEIAFVTPRFSFDAANFSGSGGFKVIRELRLPTWPVAEILKGVGQKALADALPASVAMRPVKVLKDDGNGGKVLDGDQFLDTLTKLSTLSGGNLDVKPLRPVVSEFARAFNRLPQDFRDYLDIDIPDQLDFALAVTPGSGFGLKFDIRTSENKPLRLLVPGALGLTGLTISKLSLGEALGGNLLVSDMDVVVDQFDFLSLGASLLVPEEITKTLTETNKIQTKLILKDLLLLVIWQTAVPIPIPVYFQQVGYKYYGLQGLQSQFLLCNNISDFSISKLLKGAVAILKELKGFFTDDNRMLPAKLFSDNNLNIGVNATPGFIQLPPYLGGKRIGKGEGETLFTLGPDELLVPVANYLKKPDPAKLLEIIPLEYRNQAIGVESPVGIGPFDLKVAWLLATCQELEELVRARAQRPSAFLTYLYANDDAKGSEWVTALQDAVKTADTPPGGNATEGVVLYLAGQVALPIAKADVRGFMGLIADQQKGLLTGFRFTGRASDLVELYINGSIGIAAIDHPLTKAPAVDLSGTAEFRVLDHQVINGSLGLKNGDFTFAGDLSLFPADSPFNANANAKGLISKKDLVIDCQAQLSLPPLPATTSQLHIGYDQAILKTTWLGQEWDLAVTRQNKAEYVLSALAPKPVSLLPDLVTLTDNNNDQLGPSLCLTGSNPPIAVLSGKIQVPMLKASGGGTVSIKAGEVTGNADCKLLDSYNAKLAFHGKSLDPAYDAFSYTATFEDQELLNSLHDGMTDGFNAVVAEVESALERAAEALQEAEIALQRALNEAQRSIEEALQTNRGEIEARINGILCAPERQVRDRAYDLYRLAEQDIEKEDRYYNNLSGLEKAFDTVYHKILQLKFKATRVLAKRTFEIASESLRVCQSGFMQLSKLADQVLNELYQAEQVLIGKQNKIMDAIKYPSHLIDNASLNGQIDELLKLHGQKNCAAIAVSARENHAQAGARWRKLDVARRSMQGKQITQPFVITRLEISGTLSVGANTSFKASADIRIHFSEVSQEINNINFTLDFSDLLRSTKNLARDLWNRRSNL